MSSLLLTRQATVKTPLLDKGVTVAKGSTAVGGATAATATKAVSYRSLFRYATTAEMFGLIVGLTASLANGAALPLFSLLFGQLLDDLNDPSDMVSRVSKVAVYFLIVGSGSFVASLGEITLLNLIATSQLQSAADSSPAGAVPSCRSRRDGTTSLGRPCAAFL